MTYGMTVHYDIEIEFVDILEPGEKPFIVVPETAKKTGGSHGIEMGEPDYAAEIAEFKQMTAGNYKKEAMGPADMETLDQVHEGGQGAPVQGGELIDDAKSPSQFGGAPKKVERKKRVKSVEVEMTAAAAAEIREASERSLKGNVQRRTMTLEKIFLGKFPIMVQSEFCILNGLPRDMKFSMGECKNDVGGYFIIDGKEKTVVPQEKFGDNMLYIRKVDDDTYAFSAEIRSVSENVSKPIRTLSLKIKKPTGKYSFENIVVNIPNVRNPVPLFIVFRALGILSDKEIITMCLLDLDKYASMVDLFIPSVHDAGAVLTQQSALMYIASLTKYGTVTYALEILADYFLPHVGETNHLQKAYYLGYMVFRLLSAYTGTEPATDRDNFKFKRVELVGSLIYDLFREYYTLQQREIHLDFEKRLYYNKSMYAENLMGLIQQNYRDVLKERHVELGFKKAFKGNWGAETHTKRVGIVQDLNRLSYNSAIAHLRKTNLPLDASAKVVGPRLLHCSQWGYIDPIDTPDGGNIGLHKSLAMMTYISRGYSREPMIQWLREKLAMKTLEECGPALLSTMVKVMVNGYWAGALDSSPFQAVQKMKLFRRNALLPIYTSVTFDIPSNTIYIYTDAGRVCRPIFYKNEDTQRMSYETKEWTEVLTKKEFTWSELTTGLNKKKVANWESELPRIYELHELYGGVDAESNPAKLERFLKHHAMIDYIDPSESENALIAMNPEEAGKPNNRYTHMEIHESLIFGVMCNQITFPENNPPTRNSFSSGQSKQAVSMYHTNFQMRMDKTAVVLNYGQIPLVKTRYLEHINQEENPYGENTIVAIMCYTGYNVEDAVLINEGALKRGLFNTTYYTVYETHEENSKNANSVVDKKFTNIEMEADVVGTKPGYDYSKLDKFGIIRENTPVNDKTVLIGLTSNSVENKGVRIDMSKTPKKGQVGVVDKSFVTEGEEGERIAKVRIREIRVPNLGDKMACALPTQQVLTNLGWVEIKDIDINFHKVATLDVSGNMCYEHPTNKFEYDHNGQMYYVKNKQVHVICTLNHKLYVHKRHGKKYELIEARDVMGKMMRFKKTMINVQPDVEWMTIGDKRFKMDDWLQLLGMFISDGSVNNRAVVLSCCKQRKIDFNTDILTKLGLKYKHDPYHAYFALNKGEHKEIYEELKKYSLGALNKYLPEYVWSLSQRQSIILMEALMEGDGHTYKDGFSRYGTISMKLANDVSRLAVHCGWSGIIKIASEPDGTGRKCIGTEGYKKGKWNIAIQKHTYYKISIIRKQNEPYINKKVNDSNEEKLIDYEGKVYCIEMPSSHLYYMRENNFAASMLIGNSRNGQKGTVGLVISEADMPFTKDGLRPDIIINPHAIPTRMTIGQLVECITGKTCAAYGGFGDCTAFNNRGSKIGLFGEYLTKAGYHSSGNEILYNGMTGEQLESDIFIGPTYYMRLKHMVKDKINYRALGPRTALTKQPVSGRANDGGLRIGEMERDVLIAHGLNNFLKESMMERGDKYYMAICNKTGMLSIYNPAKNIFMSPMADGPIQFTGSVDGKDMHIEHVTRFGRDFSVVCVPYSLKLLIQELQTMNIQMRLITEDNIEQLENLSFSKNIHRLLHAENVKTKDVVANIRKELATSVQAAKTPERIKDGSEGMVWKVQENNADSPVYVPADTPPYVAADTPLDNKTTTEDLPPFTFYGNPKYPESQGGQGVLGGHEQRMEQRMEVPEYRAGEPVFYRGGTKANRLWKIKDVGSGEFITIETDDLDGIEDIGDSIKVVSPMDIYRPGMMPEYTMAQGYPAQGYPAQGFPDQGYPGQGFPGQGYLGPDPFGNPAQSPYPEINVNPVIKIVNGPDNSIDTSTHAADQPNNSNSAGRPTMMLPPPTSLVSLGGSSTTKEKPPSSSNPSTGGGEVDFNKGPIMIKKV